MSLIIQDSIFRRKVDRALEQVQRVLENNKHPVYASEAAHKYMDKYLLAEFLTNAAVASHLTSLSNCGITADQLATMMEWAKTRKVTLRFKAAEKCTFLKKVTRTEDSATQRVTESSTFGTFKSKVVTTITEYLWHFEYTYELLAYRGVDVGDCMQIRTRTSSHEITTSTDTNPRKENVIHPSLDVNITWLLTNLYSPASGVIVPNFSINRAPDACRTPSNNPDIAEASLCFEKMTTWAMGVHSYFTAHIYPLMQGNALDLSAINSDRVFVPVLPIFNNVAANTLLEISNTENSSELAQSTGSEPAARSVLFGVGDINSFLGEEQRSLTEKFSALETVFHSSSLLVSSVEAQLLVILLHMRDVVQFYLSGIHAIEEMLRNQLVAAIGKVVGPSEFSNYMRFHNNKVFAEAYRPKPFCYAVRRSATHSPEGVLSIEERLADGSMPDPIYTVCNGPADGSLNPMRFTLNAATSVTFNGDRYVHAWLSHKFQYNQYDSNESKIMLKASSRQFSGYVVLVGRISSASSFDPKFGMIVQNKDELEIPLDLERIPSAKEFKDAIDSLSPEQQEFAKAFRGMQLESTLFGVMVVQIKPQLEKLLRLCPDSLTKEIKLTQDLMELFITYQLPSDLLSFGGEDDAPSADRIAEVKGYVKAMQDMISESKARELEEKRERDKYNSNMAFGGSACADSGPSFSAPPPLPTSARFTACRPQFPASPPPPPGASAPKIRALAASVPMPQNRSQQEVPAPQLQPKIENAKPSVADATSSPPSQSNQTSESDSEAVVDYTKIPRALEKQFEQLDKEGAVRPTIINPGSLWTKRAQKALLADPTTSTLNVDDQKSEKNRAFDLLDALSRSGGLSVDHASLHVIVAATHCFDTSLMDTIVKSNVNPIEKVERSTMIIASTIHGKPVEELVQGEHRGRLVSSGLSAFE